MGHIGTWSKNTPMSSKLVVLILGYKTCSQTKFELDIGWNMGLNMGFIAVLVNILTHPYMGTWSKTEPISLKLGILI